MCALYKIENQERMSLSENCYILSLYREYLKISTKSSLCRNILEFIVGWKQNTERIFPCVMIDLGITQAGNREY